ncbi:DUF6350 family protein [uncultured Bifidobacterium sp.]|uniref:cell division protein PerM n=1 Tax=uncultured Bifidobacterium sp. TaxID=165187 RepID=UPI0026048DF0|nr:DUF6350 family protein [uncultured Bifidobacterium sp.]
MRHRIRPVLSGILVSLCSLLLYSLAIGLFVALTLLVISMEEGEGEISQSSLPLMQAVVLQTQGVGITWGSVTITLVPLLLSAILIGLIAALANRLGTSLPGYISGGATWAAASWVFTQGVEVTLHGQVWLIILKTLLVFTLGYLLGFFQGHPDLVTRASGAIRHVIPPSVRRMVRIGLQMSVIIICLSIGVGFIVTTTWIIRNHSGMETLFTLLDMKSGSRILTTICTMSWLPNLWLWGLSWVSGSGFSIGSSSTFTLWEGHSSSLPPIPLFGVLPDPIGSDGLRMALLLIPAALGFLTMSAALVVNKGFHLRPDFSNDPQEFLAFLPCALFPVVSVIISAAGISLGCSALFALSNGSLGTRRLSHVGVDVADATRSVTRGTIWGMLAAWLLVLLVFCAIFAVRWAWDAIHTHTHVATARRERAEESPRVVASTTPSTKEENDDNR